MRKLMGVALFGALGILMLVNTGCMTVASPAIGTIFTDVRGPITATTATNATKQGEACAQSIFGWVATANASIAVAKANGGITEVSSVVLHYTNILGILGTFCTVVKGK